jgi:coatomer subunit beta
MIEKKNNHGKLKEEFLLVVNSLRKDLTHPNEFIRGRTLRLISKLPYHGNLY